MKKFLLSLLTVIFCISLITPAFAANVCGNISGSSSASKSFTINTGSRWLGSDKVTFTQSKGTYTYSTPFSYSKKTTGYMCYKVSYRAKGTSSWSTKQWKSRKLTLSLKKNTTYEVNVTPYSNIDMGFQAGKSITSWTLPSYWSVSATKGILSCS